MANRDIFDKNRHPSETRKVPKQVPTNPEGQHLEDHTDYFQPPLRTPGRAPSGTLSLFDPDNPDRQMMDEVEMEMIVLSAPPSKLYRVDRERTDVDDLHGEAEIRYYLDPITVYGSYEDTSYEQELTRFGLDERQEIEITFNYTYLMRECGGQVNEGDMLQTYDGRLWEAMSSVVQNEPLWRAQHNVIQFQRVAGEGYLVPDPNHPGEYIDLSDSPNIGSEGGFEAPEEEEKREKSTVDEY